MDKTNKMLIMVSAIIALIIMILIVLFLTRKPSIYTITFDTDGGTTVLDQSVKKNSKVLKPADPTKKGYIFIEWQYNKKPFDFDTEVDKDMTLLATWQEAKEDAEMINIEFDSDGGSLVSKQIIEKGTKVTKPEEPTRKDYKFIEWILDDKPFDFENEVEKDIILKAKWEKVEEKPSEKSKPKEETPKENDENTQNEEKKYTVTFNTTGGSEIASKTVSENKRVNKPTDPTKKGYEFDEWLLNGNTYNFDEPVTEDLNLVASWYPNKYIIVYNPNIDANINAIQPTMCEYDKECSLNSNGYTTESYTFLGWSTSPSGSVTYSSGASVLNLTSTDGETITLYAVWQQNE